MPAENTSTVWGIRYPTAANAGAQFAQGIADMATDIDSRLTFAVRAISASATAVSGQLIVVTGGTPLTVTLPAPAANAVVAVFAKAATGASPVTVAVNGGNIYGLGLAGTTTLLLGAAGAEVVLQSDGTNWFVIDGQQDTGWVPLSLGSGISSGFAAARLVGDRGWLRGALTNGTGSSVAAGTTLASIVSPVPFPASSYYFATVTAVPNASVVGLVNSGNGAISLSSAWPFLSLVYFAGLSYSITGAA